MGQRRPAVAFEEWALLAEIRAEMGRRGWNRDRMARESGIPPTNVYRYFLKATRSPSPSDLFAAAKALGVPLSELAERAEAVTDAALPRDVAAWLGDVADDPIDAALLSGMSLRNRQLAAELLASTEPDEQPERRGRRTS